MARAVDPEREAIGKAGLGSRRVPDIGETVSGIASVKRALTRSDSLRRMTPQVDMLAVGNRLVRLLYSVTCRWLVKRTTDRFGSSAGNRFFETAARYENADSRHGKP